LQKKAVFMNYLFTSLKPENIKMIANTYFEFTEYCESLKKIMSATDYSFISDFDNINNEIL